MLPHILYGDYYNKENFEVLYDKIQYFKNIYSNLTQHDIKHLIDYIGYNLNNNKLVDLYIKKKFRKAIGYFNNNTHTLFYIINSTTLDEYKLKMYHYDNRHYHNGFNNTINLFKRFSRNLLCNVDYTFKHNTWATCSSYFNETRILSPHGKCISYFNSQMKSTSRNYFARVINFRPIGDQRGNIIYFNMKFFFIFL